MNRNVSVIKDIDGNDIVIINDIEFKGKRSIDWDDVKKYLERFVGEHYIIESTSDMIYIGKDFPDEYTGSKSTYELKGTRAKAKANSAQGIPEIVRIATEKSHKDNEKKKHSRDAKYGWYKYNSKFALPVYDSDGELERYNIFRVSLIVRHSIDGKMYLYDIINIKKEASNPFNA